MPKKINKTFVFRTENSKQTYAFSIILNFLIYCLAPTMPVIDELKEMNFRNLNMPSLSYSSEFSSPTEEDDVVTVRKLKEVDKMPRFRREGSLKHSGLKKSKFFPK